MQSHKAQKPQKPIIICGPTASGKSALAIQLAQKIGAVIINADSQQVYKEIPILSAQPSIEEQSLVPHYLFGEIPGNQVFNTAIWLEKVKLAIKNHQSSIIVGGTGLYLNALFNGLSPIPNIPAEIREKARKMEKSQLVEELGAKADGNTNRMRRNLEVKLATGKYIDEFYGVDNNHEFKPEDFIILNLNVSRETIYANIDRRFLAMLENGAIEEVQNLLTLNYSPSLPIMKAVGVPEIKAYLESEAGAEPAMSPRSGASSERQEPRTGRNNKFEAGAEPAMSVAEQQPIGGAAAPHGGNNKFVSRETMASTAQQKSRNYAKRQMTWFRNQLPVHRILVKDFTEAWQVVNGKR